MNLELQLKFNVSVYLIKCNVFISWRKLYKWRFSNSYFTTIIKKKTPQAWCPPRSALHHYVINLTCNSMIWSLCFPPAPQLLITPSHFQSPPTSNTPTGCGKARQHDLWHLKKKALKSLWSKTDGLGRLEWQGDSMTGPEAKRDPKAVALKCRRQHTEGGRGGGRVLAITGLID